MVCRNVSSDPAKLTGMAISEYVQRLRSIVGHDWLLLASAVALIERNAGELLFVRQVGMHGWSLPGGAIEFGETPVEAVIREVAEETGLRCLSPQLITVVGGPRYRVAYPNGDKVEYTSAIYRARCVDDSAMVADGNELAELRWCTKECIGDLAMIPYVENLLVDLDLL